MIQRIIFIGILAAFICGAAISKALDCSDRVSLMDSETPDRIMTKAVEFNGEVIPAIELPEVAVSGQRPDSHWADATVVDGQTYPSYLLSTVVVRPAE